jgi:hypothetical protein
MRALFYIAFSLSLYIENKNLQKISKSGTCCLNQDWNSIFFFIKQKANYIAWRKAKCAMCRSRIFHKGQMKMRFVNISFS